MNDSETFYLTDEGMAQMAQEQEQIAISALARCREHGIPEDDIKLLAALIGTDYKLI